MSTSAQRAWSLLPAKSNFLREFSLPIEGGIEVKQFPSINNSSNDCNNPIASGSSEILLLLTQSRFKEDMPPIESGIAEREVPEM